MKTFLIIVLIIEIISFIVNLLAVSTLDFPHEVKWSKGEYCIKIVINVTIGVWVLHLLRAV